MPSSPRVLFTIGQRPKAERYLDAPRQRRPGAGCRTDAHPRPLAVQRPPGDGFAGRALDRRRLFESFAGNL